MIVQKLKTSVGIGGASTTVGDSTRVVTSSIVNLASTRVPKQTASILFLQVTAYILGINRIGWLSNTSKHDAP